MPDICDHANEEMEFLNQIKFSRTPPPVQPSATHCCDCGNPIPKRRREAVAGSGDVWIVRPSWNISSH